MGPNRMKAKNRKQEYKVYVFVDYLFIYIYYSGQEQHRPELNFKCALTWTTGSGDFLGNGISTFWGQFLDTH